MSINIYIAVSRDVKGRDFLWNSLQAHFQKQFLVIPRTVTVDVASERFAVDALILVFDRAQVHLRPSHNESDQIAVPGACTTHGVVKTLCQVGRLVIHGLDDGYQPVFDIPGEFAADGVHQTTSPKPAVLLQCSLSHGRGVGGEDPVELRLVRSCLVLTSFIELLSQLWSHLELLISLLPRASRHGNEQPAEVA